MTREFTYTTQDGHLIPITLYAKRAFEDAPCILYIHGFKGFKDWGFVPYAGKYFAAQGINFVAFNFSHNGIGDKLQEFTELQKFKDNTFSLELSEVKELIHLCIHTDFFGGYLRHKLGLLGHSRGGGIAILAAAQSPDVAALTTWASVANFDRFSKKDKQEWRSKGYREVVNSRTGQVFQMGLPMLQDIEKHAKGALHILNAAKRFKRPFLILHGKQDETIPYFEAEHINIYAEPDHTTLRLVANTGHTFGAKHPFDKTTPELEEVLELSTDFFKQHLI